MSGVPVMFGDEFRRLKESHRQLGGPMFWTMLIGTLVYIGVGSWLSIVAAWPGQCDHEGRSVVGIAKEIYCSPDLLGGGAIEIGLFAWLWSLICFPLVAIAWSWINHWKRQRHNRLDSE